MNALGYWLQRKGGHGMGEVTVGDQTLNPECKEESPGRDGVERVLLQTHG